MSAGRTTISAVGSAIAIGPGTTAVSYGRPSVSTVAIGDEGAVIKTADGPVSVKDCVLEVRVVRRDGSETQFLQMPAWDLEIAGTVHHAELHGGSCTAKEATNITVTGGSVTIEGDVAGNVKATGGTVHVDGSIGGSVSSVGGFGVGIQMTGTKKRRVK